jgi:hypothetical protein
MGMILNNKILRSREKLDFTTGKKVICLKDYAVETCLDWMWKSC